MLTPIAWARANDSSALDSAPLCSPIPTGPGVSGSGTVRANGATLAEVFRKPRQFGPSSTIPCAAACATRVVFELPAVVASLPVTRGQDHHVPDSGRRRRHR